MKTAYNAPKVTEHGNVEEITQAFGSVSLKDTIFIGGANVEAVGTSTGSQDGIIKPV